MWIETDTGIRRDGSRWKRPRDPILWRKRTSAPSWRACPSWLVSRAKASRETIAFSWHHRWCHNYEIGILPSNEHNSLITNYILNPFAPLYSLQRDLQNYIHIWYILKLFYTTINLCWICNHNICTTCVSICIIFYKFVYFSRQGSVFKFYLHHCIFLQQYLQYKIHFDMFWIICIELSTYVDCTMTTYIQMYSDLLSNTNLYMDR